MTGSDDRLIVALDVPDGDAARALVDQLGGRVGFYKIGLELIYAGAGLPLARSLVAQGKKIFLDAKLHDIPNTVAAATGRLSHLGASFLTVHAYPQTMRAAQSALRDGGLKLLAVTVLTSSDDADLVEAGYAHDAATLVRRRCQQAQECGVAGLVMSPHEIAAARALLGPGTTIVTPGVRPAGSAAGDQKRVMTPAEALDAGADHLVIGRPITASPDPAFAAETILAEMASVVRR